MYIVIAIIIFGILIVVHELGHFVAAKAFGVKVLEFSIGMGPQNPQNTGQRDALLPEGPAPGRRLPHGGGGRGDAGPAVLYGGAALEAPHHPGCRRRS